MATKVRNEVYLRLVLAKTLLAAGESACASQNDQYVFTKGILLLHDAAEAALGAVADHLHAKLRGDIYLLKYFDIIERADPKKRIVLYKSQMRNLNTLRNNAKHEGLLPSPKSNIHFPATVSSFIEELCKNYFGLNFSTINLLSLIRDDNIKKWIGRAQDAIKNGKFEEALISLAYAMYYICDSTTMPWYLPLFAQQKEEKPLAFTRPFERKHKITIIEHGVDPYLYYRFKNLTPLIGKERETRKLVYWWDKNYGHSANWTNRNAVFCINFCIETALKFQREDDEGYTLVSYNEVYEDVVEPVANEAVMWDCSHDTKTRGINPAPAERKKVLVLKKGQQIVGWATDDEDTLDEWFIISKDIPSERESGSGYGYVLKKDVKITQRDRKPV